MSDGNFGGLVDYYKEFVPEYLPKSNGKPRSRRSAQAIAKRYNLPLVRIALRSFIDPQIAAEQLKAAQIRKRAEPRGAARRSDKKSRPRNAPRPAR